MEMKKRNRKELVVGYVCTGNLCRSPIAEALAKKMVNEIGAERELLEITSRGTGVERMQPPNDFKADEFLPYIEKALTTGFLSNGGEKSLCMPTITKMARRALETKGSDRIATQDIIFTMLQIGDHYRNIAVAEVITPHEVVDSHIPPILETHVPRQLTKSDDIDIILAMSNENKSSAKHIFLGADRIPEIITLGESIMNPTVGIPDPMAGNLQEYRNAVEEFMPIVARSITRLVLYSIDMGMRRLISSVMKQHNEDR